MIDAASEAPGVGETGGEGGSGAWRVIDGLVKRSGA